MAEEFVVGVGLGQEFNIRARLHNWLSLRVKHDLYVVTVAHSQLLAEDGDLAISAVPNEYRTLRRSDHDLRILALVYEALGDVLVNVQLAIVAEANGKVFSIQLTRSSIEKFSLFLLKEQFAVGSFLRSPILIVPRVFPSGSTGRGTRLVLVY